MDDMVQALMQIAMVLQRPGVKLRITKEVSDVIIDILPKLGIKTIDIYWVNHMYYLYGYTPEEQAKI